MGKQACIIYANTFQTAYHATSHQQYSANLGVYPIMLFCWHELICVITRNRVQFKFYLKIKAIFFLSFCLSHRGAPPQFPSSSHFSSVWRNSVTSKFQNLIHLNRSRYHNSYKPLKPKPLNILHSKHFWQPSLFVPTCFCGHCFPL